MARRKPVSFDKRGRITGGDIFERAALRDARRAVDKGLQISDRAFKNLGANTLEARQGLVNSLEQRATSSGRGFDPVRGGRNLGLLDRPNVRQAAFSLGRVMRRGGSLDDLSPFVRRTLLLGDEKQAEPKQLGSRNRDNRPYRAGSREDERSSSMFGRRRRR